MLLETPRLLITDDDRDFRATLAEVLRSRGFETLEAGDGEEALDVLNRCQVHLLLMDMHMPRLSGLETIRRVRQLDLEMQLPWILISAALDEAIVAEAQAAAAFSVLPKPLRLPQLTTAVHQALHRSITGRSSVVRCTSAARQVAKRLRRARRLRPTSLLRLQRDRAVPIGGGRAMVLGDEDGEEVFGLVVRRNLV